MYNTSENLIRIKRILALIVSAGLICLSIWFSKLGFGIESSEEYAWIGWFLGVSVTVIQLVFNTNIQKLNPTLVGAGILAYAYGIYTNVVGLRDILGDNIWFAITVGLFVEVLPEPLFAWSIGVTDGGDVVGNIGHLFGGSPTQSRTPTIRPQPMGFQHPDKKENRPWTYPPVNNNKGKHHKGSNPRKVVSNLFNDSYTDKFKK